MAGEDDLHLNASMDGDLEAALGRLEARIDSVENTLEKLGVKAKVVGDQVAAGQRKAQESLDDTKKSADKAARAVDEAGDEAAQSGVKAAVASTGWEKLDRAIARNEKTSRLWQRTMSMFRFSTYSSQVDSLRGAWEKFNAFDFKGVSKKINDSAKSMGGFSRIAKVAMLGLKAFLAVAAVGLASSLIAGLVAATGALGGLAKGTVAALPLFVAAKVAMLAWKQAATAVAPQLDALKAKFAGIGEAVAKGGLRKGLAQLTADVTGFARVTDAGMSNVGRALGKGAAELGVIAKNGDRLASVGRIFDSMGHILDFMIGTVLRLGQAFLVLLDAASPVGVQMAEDMRRASQGLLEWMDAANKSGKLTQWIQAGYDQLKRTIGVVVDVLIGLFNVFRIGAQQAGFMGDGIESLATKFRVFTQSADGQNKIAKYFQDAMPAFKETLLLIRDLAVGIAGFATSEGMAPMINQLRTEFLPAILDVLHSVSGQGGLLPSLLDGFTELAKMFTSLDLSGLTTLANIFAAVVTGLTNMIQNVPGLQWLVSTFALLWVVGGGALKIIGAGMAAFAWVKGAILLTGELTLAQTLFGKAVSGASTAVTWLGLKFLALTGASTIMEGIAIAARAMWAAITGPVGLIIIAIIAVVAVVIYLYNNCEWFRDAVNAVWSAIVTAAQAVGDFFVFLGGIFVSVWQAIAGAFVWAWDNVISPVLNVILTILKVLGAIIFVILVAPFVIAWNIICAVFTWAYETIIGPLLQMIGDKINWLNTNVVQPILGWIAEKWTWLTTMVGIAIGILVGAIQTVNAKIAEFWNIYIAPILGWVADRWNWLVLMVQLAVGLFLNLMGGVGGGISNLWTTYVSPILQWIADRWNWLMNLIMVAKQTYLDPVFDGIGAGLDRLGTWFRGAVDNIGQIWNDLRSKLAVPINFVIDKVWNNGILAVWNWVAEKIGLPVGQPLAMIPEFASGGAIRGPGTGTSDSIMAAVSNGEHVWTAEEVRRAGGHKHVEEMRRVAARGGRRGLDSYLQFGGENLRQFADGGPVVAKAQGFAQGEAGKPYQMGGVGPAVYDCSGFMSAITNVIFNREPHRRIFATGAFTKNSGAGGFVPGLGSAFGIGVSPNTGDGIGHMAGTLGGMNVESNGSMGVVVGSRARGAQDSLFPWQFSLPQVGGVFTGGGGDGWTWDIAKAALDAIINPLIDMIPFHGPPQFMDIPHNMATTARDAMYGWAKGKLEALMSFAGGGLGGQGDAAVRAAVQQMAARYGWDTGANWDSLDKLIQGESSWDPTKKNPTTSAAGLFQKMQSVHGSVESSVAGQAAWGLNYIKGKYGDPVTAYRTWSGRSPHWYDDGGMLPTGLSMVMNGTGSPEPVFTGMQWDNISGLLDSTAQLVGAPATYARDDAELVGAVRGLATMLDERPPPLAVSSDEVRKEVEAALRSQRREREASGRYHYGD